MNKTGLVLRVKQATGVERILLDEFRFSPDGTTVKAPNFNPRRFLRCMYCGYDAFVELAVNFLECDQCESKIEIIPRNEEQSQ
ncbi:hypothetical protein PY247_10475 [Acinetobacter proteolyticus]|nr:hypothetical protein [Acinetobacter proteolyticus]WEI17380.1 hypothetical protein PY247_12855 [Acinetobacter proteolyticus]WEI20098.1 hypothetical protein PY247_10475 [Acinetobacter proteolyticus]